MPRPIAAFVKFNADLASGFDRVAPYPPLNTGPLNELAPREMFATARRIGDVGGGKKPYATERGLERGERTYVGMDIDADELARAPAGVYSSTEVLDICAPPAGLRGAFDLIICRNTLEHVRDTAAAIEGLGSMLAPGGRCFIRLPCRKALFAKLNLVLPNELKRKILHAAFPGKEGDGFPAFYDKATPSELRALATSAGLKILAEKRNYRSTYFSFFLPLYLLWRAAQSVQYLTDPDYCESIELVLGKPDEAATP